MFRSKFSADADIHPLTVYLKDYHVSAYLIDEIILSFHLDEEATLVHSSMQVKHNPTSPHSSLPLVLNGKDLSLENISLDGKPLSPSDYQIMPNTLVIPHTPDCFNLSLTTKINPLNNTLLSGLYYSEQIYCTQCEAEGFRRITYFLDRPDILTHFTTTIIAEKTRYPILLSNGNLIDSGELEQGKHWVTWKDPFKKPCYLFALVAGNFDILTDHFLTQSKRSIALQIYVDKGKTEMALHAMYALKTAMRWDEINYGREYDLDTYMIVGINNFNMGAMENKGLNIFNTQHLLASPASSTDDNFIQILATVGHEYFHNWTGNRITCRDWFQLSLKEGLTIFREQCFLEDTLSPILMRLRDVAYLREVQFLEDQGPLAHAVYPNAYIEINNFYTATIYNKGAEIIRMLQLILGKILFRKAMDAYFKLYDGQAATIENYIATMENISGINLSQFKQWYTQIGTPLIHATSQYDAHQKIYTLMIQQEIRHPDHSTSAIPLHIPICISLLDQHVQQTPARSSSKSKQTLLHLTQKKQQFQFKDISFKPIPSLLQHFSAPVKLNIDYSNEELIWLIEHNPDDFNRFEASQRYMLKMIEQLCLDDQQNRPLQLPQSLLTLLERILSQHTPNLFLKSAILKVPSEILIGEQMPIIDVEGIYRVRTFMMTALAQALQTPLLTLYHQYHKTPYTPQFSIKETGKRQLKNLCLAYLNYIPTLIEDLNREQFKTALKINMTDTLAALSGLVRLPDESIAKKTALHQFFTTWKEDPCVLDKWFAVQASSDYSTTLNTVKKLTYHPAFSLYHPNTVYALLGTLGQHNRIVFHAKEGTGYIFLQKMVLQLDKINSIVAAQIVQPLTHWKRYDAPRQMLMKQTLTAILNTQPISKDLYELVSKSIAT